MPFGKFVPIAFKLLLPWMLLALLQASPSSYAVSTQLAAARQAQQEARHQDAADALHAVVTREPWRSSLWEEIGREAYAAGQPEQAASALLAAANRGTLSSDGRFLLGEVYLQLRDNEAAEATWQTMLRDEGPSTPVYERLVQLQRARQDIPAAIETLRAWHANIPDARAAFLLGLYLSATQPEQALPLLLEAGQRDFGYGPAVQSLRSALALASSTDQPAYGWVMIGRALGSIDQWDLAQEAFQKATDLSPQYAEAWAFLGEARAQQGGSGSQELERARSLAPDSTLVKALLALALRRQGKPQQALENLMTVAQQEPEEPIWQVEIANTLVDIGDLSAARTYFERATTLAPKDTRYWQILAHFSIQYNVDIRGLGLPAARQAVLLAQDDPAALDTMGWTLANLGDSASAERFLQHALEQDATYVPANLHLGQIYLERQESGQAYFYLSQADNFDREGQVGEVARRLLRRYFQGGG